MSAEITITKNRAMKLCEEIREGMGSIADKIFELKDGDGWKVLGYATWNDCCEAEFQHPAWWAARQLRVASVKALFPPKPPKSKDGQEDGKTGGRISPTTPTTDSHLLELAKVPKADRAAVLEWAEEKADGGKVTAKLIKEAIAEVAEAEPEEEESDIPEPEEPEKPLGKTIPKHLKATFAAAARFDKAMNLCTALTKAINELREDTEVGIVFAGRGVAAQALKDVENVRHALKFSKPYAACPYCRARGCNACIETGWVGEGVYRSAPGEKR
jgi:hypothetical protein